MTCFDGGRDDSNDDYYGDTDDLTHPSSSSRHFSRGKS